MITQEHLYQANYNQPQNSSLTSDPEMIEAAKAIYEKYCSTKKKLTKTPVGVAIDAKTHRGQLIFREKPLLLPGERFILMSEIQSEMY